MKHSRMAGAALAVGMSLVGSSAFAQHSSHDPFAFPLKGGPVTHNGQGVGVTSLPGISPLYNGVEDNGTNAFGWYYIITGGKTPLGYGGTRNGDNASGGTFRFVTDSPAYLYYPVDVWQKDDWFTYNFSFGLSLLNGSTLVFDDTGIPDNTIPYSGKYYWNTSLGGPPSDAGCYRGFAMSNDWDWIYAGYFPVVGPTTFDTIVGYFDGDGIERFQPLSRNVRYRFNIWTEDGSLLPTATGKFTGDVLSSDTVDSTVTVEPTGINRIPPSGVPDPIWKVTFKLKNPVTLPAGNYYFSHDIVHGNGWTPVDLNGRYFAAAAQTYPGLSIAATGADPTYGQVIERSRDGSINAWDPNAVEGTYTPFSDAVKPPRAMSVSSSGTTFVADIDATGTWVANDEAFGVAVSNSTLSAGVRLTKSGSSYVVGLTGRMAGPPYTIESGGTAYTAASDETAFRVQVSVDSLGQLSGKVWPLNGAQAGTEHDLGTYAPTIGSISGPVVFTAGFTSEVGVTKPNGAVRVRNFETNAVANNLYVTADNPYIKSSGRADYRFTMTGLQQSVLGYQAFLQSHGVQTYDSTSVYTYADQGLFPTILLPMNSSLQLSAGVATGQPAAPASEIAKLADLRFTPTGEGTAWVGVNADNGSGIPTRFSDSLAQPVTPARLDSNIVVVDDTLPVLTQFSATQGAVDATTHPIVLGNLLVEVNARDFGQGGSNEGSGLAERPKIVLNFSPTSNNGTGPEDVVLDTYSWTGNKFRAEYNVTASAPSGPAEIIVSAIDDAGNSVSQTESTGGVNTTTVTLSVELASVGASPTRWVHFVLGGDGSGANSPVHIDKLVTFTANPQTVVLNAYDGPETLPANGPASFDEVSAVDPLHTLRANVAMNHVGNQYTGSGLLSLKGGDANRDNVIDILDFGVFAYQYGTNPAGSPNSYIGESDTNADFSCDHGVGTEDFTFLQNGFLSVGDSEPGNFAGPGRTPQVKCTVKDMVKAGVAESVARAMDADKDGWITVNEVTRWLDAKLHIKPGARG